MTVNINCLSDFRVSSYDYKVYNKIGTELIEIFDFDFSNIHTEAEYEKLEYLYLPFTKSYLIQGYSVEDLLVNLIKLTSPYTKIRLIYSICEITKKKILEYLINKKIDLSNIEIIAIKFDCLFIRDSFPTFVKDKKTGETIAIKTYFNNYDTNKLLKNENDAIIELIKQLPEVSKVVVSNYTQDGGARMFNGNGTMVLCEHYERKKNPDFEKNKTENLFRKFFGVENFIWVPHTSVFDDSDFFGKIYYDEEENIISENHLVTDGHVDGFLSFAGPNKILFTSPNKEDDENKYEIDFKNERRMKINFQTLIDARDKNGNKFIVEELPCEVDYFEMFPADFPNVQNTLNLNDSVIEKYLKENKMIYISRLGCYANFIIVNDLVVMNSLYKEGMDDSVKKSDEECFELLKKTFPNKKIEMIDAEAINWGGGSLHCICAQQMK